MTLCVQLGSVFLIFSFLSKMHNKTIVPQLSRFPCQEQYCCSCYYWSWHSNVLICILSTAILIYTLNIYIWSQIQWPGLKLLEILTQQIFLGIIDCQSRDDSRRVRFPISDLAFTKTMSSSRRWLVKKGLSVLLQSTVTFLFKSKLCAVFVLLK